MTDRVPIAKQPRVFDKRFVVAAASVALLVLIGGYFLYVKSTSSDEERPPIIISSGSIRIEGGDRSNPTPPWKDWQADTSAARRWRPNHLFGASVRDFEVTVNGATNAAECPATVVNSVSDVEVDYSAGATNPAVHVYYASPASGGRRTPVVDSSVDMTHEAQSASAPGALVYDPGSGYISQIRVKPVTGTTISCTFDQTSKARVKIQPTR